MLNCANAEEVTSAAVASSTSPAAARSNSPGIPATISLLFQPAIARFSIAPAACAAENMVVSPRCFAVAVNSANSAPVAPEIALTFAMPCSKLLNVLTVSATPSDTPAKAAACAIGFDSSPAILRKGAVTKSFALRVTVQTFPASFFPADAMRWMPLVAMSRISARTSSLLLPFMPSMRDRSFVMDCSSLLTFRAALCAPLAVSSVTCATTSITVTVSFIAPPPYFPIFSTGVLASASSASSVYWSYSARSPGGSAI